MRLFQKLYYVVGSVFRYIEPFRRIAGHVTDRRKDGRTDRLCDRKCRALLRVAWPKLTSEEAFCLEVTLIFLGAVLKQVIFSQHNA